MTPSTKIAQEKLTAYQRWELAAFDEAQSAARQTPATAPPPAAPAAESAPPVVLPTAADIVRMHDEAREQGYAEGYAQGASAAQALGERMDALMSGLERSIGEIDQQVAEGLLATAVEIAGQILRQSLKIKPELLLPAVREAIAAIHQNSGHPALFLHPEDAPLVRAQLGERLSHNGWRIIEDASLTPGGCRVELGASEVDATLETRRRRVIEAIGISQDWLDERS